MSITIQVVNIFDPSRQDATDYFGSHYNDANIWLYFLNTSGKVTYFDTSTQKVVTVSDADTIQLSTVKDGSFSLDKPEDSTKLYAALGPSNPFQGSNGPGIFDPNIPYALAEWTIKGNEFDNADVSYIDALSFPTTLTIKDASGKQTAQATFQAGTKASDIIAAFENKMADTPTGPNNDNYPNPGEVGYGPLVPTVSKNPDANRWIGSSKYYISGIDSSNQRSMYMYAPSFQDYLGYLQENEPTTTTNAGNIKGWCIDYSGNKGYSGYLSITGNATSGYGLQVHDIRVETWPSAANDWQAEPNAGIATNGTITVTENGANIPFDAASTVIGAWTDAVIYSGAAVIGTLAGGPVVIGTDDFVVGGDHFDIVPTFLASISASIATGLLGSDTYITAYTNPTQPKSTMYWFNTLERGDAATTLFESAWPNKKEYYDPFWAVMAKVTDNQGYLSPFNDRWSQFEAGFALGKDYSIIWELGIRATT